VEKLQLPTSFHSNQPRIKFSTWQCVKEVICDITPTKSCHLLLRWAWLHFKMLNLDERSLYLRHEGLEMKLKFMTPRQAKKDQHMLKKKIEKERIEKKRKNWKRRNINCRRKGNWRKRKGGKEKDDGIGSRDIRCFIEGHLCLVAFVYERDNNVVSQRLVEKHQLPTSFHSNQARIKFSKGQCVKEVLCDIAPTSSCHILLRWAWLHFKALNLDEHSLYLRHEGHEMKLKFMTLRQSQNGST